MAIYRIKRALYSNGGVLDTAKQGVGTAVKTTGDMVDSGIGHLAGTIGGGMLANAIVPGAGLLTTLGGAVAGNMASKVIGKTMHNVGNDMQQ